MRKWFLIFCLGCVVTTLKAQTPENYDNASYYDGVAAYVDNKVITVDSVLKELLNSFNIASLPPKARREKIVELYPVVCDLMIEQTLILKEYSKLGMNIPDRFVRERIQTIIAENFGGDEAKLREFLRQTRMTLQDWRTKIRDNLITKAMRQTEVNDKVQVTPRQVRAYYNANKSKYTTTAGTHIWTISLADTRTRAENILEAIKKGESFESLARRYSVDEKATEGGNWGPINLTENFTEEIANGIEAMADGEIKMFSAADTYFCIVKKIATLQGGEKPLQEIWTKVEDDAIAEACEARYKEWIDELRSKAYIKKVENTFYKSQPESQASETDK